jgi:carboxyl-terminal processing protease
MKSKRDFFLGVGVGMAIITIITSVYFGAIDISNYLKDRGIVLVKKEYKTYEEKLDDILRTIDKRYLEDFNEEDLYETAYKGFVAGVGDPYTNYYTKDEYRSFMELTAGKYVGIGVVITYNELDKDIIEVETPYEGAPGYNAGLEPKDRILKIDGVEVTGMRLEDVVKLIRGEKDTEVIVTILKENETETRDVVITRNNVVIPTVHHEMLDNKIGYIRLSGFERVTYDQFMEALKDLEEQNQKGMIIDLRNNPGGLINIVTAIVDELIPKDKLIVYTEDKQGRRKSLKSKKKDNFTKPLVLLVNENSASASEIMSGAIKDYKEGLIVGTTTFGKGLVQTTYELDDGSAIKVTIQKYFTPNGNYIHDKGIEPNYTVELPDKVTNIYKVKRDMDNQLEKGIELIKEQL